jgi:hypothetical protein
MRPSRVPWIVAALAALAGAAFALAVRLPLPFEGFAIAVAAGLAFVLTLALGLALPARLLWTDEERLTHAFRKRHQVSAARASDALQAITTAHRRASALRGASSGFAETLRAQTERAADLLDGVAREIFYDPSTLQVHRANLVRSDLIEDAVRAHAALRGRRASDATEARLTASRGQVAAALAALEDAFDAAEARLAERSLTRVTVSSETAETLLAPRRAPMSNREVRKDD